MRILIVDTCYSPFVESHYGANPGLAREPYDVQWRALMDRFFGTADSYSHHLAALGHEAHEVVVDCSPLQAAWAAEHPAARGRRGPFRRKPDEVVVQQAEWFEPDVVYVQNVTWPSDRALRRLKEVSGLVVGQLASEAPSVERLRKYDLLLTSFPHFVDRFRAAGVNAEYFRIGFDERVSARLEGAPRGDLGAVFVGALNTTQHRQGNALLEETARRVPVDFWGYGATGWAADSPILARYHGEAWGLDMFRALRRGRIALNRHIDVAEGFANNMRLYEATGAGTMLLTDEGSNLSELFVPGREVETYRDGNELVDKIAHYLEHDDEREAIAQAGQARTLREHTYGLRMEELASILAAQRGAA